MAGAAADRQGDVHDDPFRGNPLAGATFGPPTARPATAGTRPAPRPGPPRPGPGRPGPGGRYPNGPRPAGPRPGGPRGPRPAPTPPVRSWLGGIAITLVSLLSGLLAFHLVSRAALPPTISTEGPARTAAPPGSDSGTGPDRTKAPAETVSGSRPPVRVAGDLLVAQAPLNRIKQDQGSSVDLPDGRTLWIFADTFQRSRSPKFFVTSAAATTLRGGRTLTYATRDGRPTEFLPRTAAERRGSVRGVTYKAVWPVGSTQLPDGRIIIAYAKYQVLLRTKQFEFLGSGLFSYRYTNAKALHRGATATRIADDIWSPAQGEVRSPVYDGGFVYFSQCQDLRCYALRTTPKGLTDPNSYRWWTGAAWSPDRGARAVVQIGSNHPGGNASVVKLNSGLFAMADTEVGAPSVYGYLWVARRPWGPWSRAASFIMPECGQGGCYGLNLHPGQSRDDVLRVGYATTRGPYVRLTDVDVSIARDGSAIALR